MITFWDYFDGLCPYMLLRINCLNLYLYFFLSNQSFAQYKVMAMKLFPDNDISDKNIICSNDLILCRNPRQRSLL